MKRLLYTILFCLISVVAFAGDDRDTVPSFLPAPYNTSYYRVGTLKTDSVLIVQIRDTNFTPKYAGGITFWQRPGIDSNFWGWNGQRWFELGFGGGGGGILNFQYGGAALGTISTLNIDTSLIASITGSTGTVFNKADTITVIYPLYNPVGPRTIAIYQSGFHQDGFLDSASYSFFWNKQNAMQWQVGGVNVGTLGGFVRINLGANMSATFSDSTITLNASSSTVLQAQLTWFDSLNDVVAAAGVATNIKALHGISFTLHGDTLIMNTVPDTIYAGGGLHATGTDTIVLGGRVFANTDVSMSNKYAFTLDSLSAGLFFTQLGNKVPAAGDSLLLVTTAGQVLKSSLSAIISADQGLTDSAGTIQWGGTLTQNVIENMNANTVTFNSNYVGGSGAFQIWANQNFAVAEGISQSGVLDVGLSIQETGTASTAISVQSSNANSATRGITAADLNSTLGIAIFGISDIGLPGAFEIENVNDSNAVETAIQLSSQPLHGRSGLGTSIDQNLPDSLGAAFLTTNRIIFRASSLVHNAASVQTEIWNINAGTLQQQLTLKHTGQLQLNNYLTTSSFTGTGVGVLEFDASGNVITAAIPGGGGGGGNFVGRDSIEAITTGAASTVTSGYDVVYIDPSVPVSTYALTTPASVHTSNRLIIHFGGTITSGTVITNFSIIANSGQTIIDNTLPPGTSMTVTPDNVLIYDWRPSTSTWYRSKP